MPEIDVPLAIPPGPVADRLIDPLAFEHAAKLGLRLRRPDTAPDGPDGWADFIGPASCIITGWTTPLFDAPTLDALPNLKLIAHAAGSVRTIIDHTAYDRGLRITSANHVLARSVVEWSVLMSLMAVRRPWQYARLGSFDGFDRDAAWPAIRSLRDTEIGIWGYGQIGRGLVEALGPLRPKRILVCDPACPHRMEGDIEFVGIEELFDRSHVLHLLAPLNDATRHAIDAALLAHLADDATLVNAGRGNLVEPDALYRELGSGRIQAILDVFHREPLPADDSLRVMPNVVLTPHCAGAGEHHQLIPEMLDEVARFLEGKPLLYAVERDRGLAMTLPSAS